MCADVVRGAEVKRIANKMWQASGPSCARQRRSGGEKRANCVAWCL